MMGATYSEGMGGTAVQALVPLGDSAALAYLADEQSAFQFAHAVQMAAPDWVVDIVQAYTSVAVFFESLRIRFDQVVTYLDGIARKAAQSVSHAVGRRHTIPCCYEFQLDLQRINQHTGVEPEEIIRFHTVTEFTVYAIGFCPGFPYLGYLPEAISGVPRLASPRLRLPAGSVGLTGRQTGIYTLDRPGGWNIIGRTPLELVNVADNYFPLQTGDRIRFSRIDELEFKQLVGQRLSNRS